MLMGIIAEQTLLIAEIVGDGEDENKGVVFLCSWETATDNSLSAHTITLLDAAAISSAQQKFGANSLALDGAADRARCALSTDFLFGSGEFTTETFARRTTLADSGTLLGVWDDTPGTPQQSWRIRFLDDAIRFQYSIDGNIVQSPIIASGVAFGVSTWHHIAVDRDSANKLRLYFDGTMIGSATVSATFFASNVGLSIGGTWDGTSSGADDCFQGQVDETRVTKGRAQYASDSGLTVPTSPHPKPGGATEMVAAAGTFILSGQNVSVAPSGTTSMSASPGAFAVTGQDVSVGGALILSAGLGNFTLTGKNVTLPELWTPANLAVAPWTWFKMDAISGSDGATVSSLTDVSGNSRNTTGVSGTPNLEVAEQNGLNVVKFLSGENYAFPSMSALTAGSAFVLVKCDHDSGMPDIGEVLYTGTVVTGGGYYPFNNGLVYSTFGVATRRDSLNAPIAMNTWHIMEKISGSGDWRYIQTGNSVFSSGTNTVAFTSTPLIAKSGLPNVTPFVGFMGEIIILGYVPTADELARLEGYLAHKWGFTGDLPGGHTYKTNPPMA